MRLPNKLFVIMDNLKHVYFLYFFFAKSMDEQFDYTMIGLFLTSDMFLLMIIYVYF